MNKNKQKFICFYLTHSEMTHLQKNSSQHKTEGTHLSSFCIIHYYCCSTTLSRYYEGGAETVISVVAEIMLSFTTVTFTVPAISAAPDEFITLVFAEAIA